METTFRIMHAKISRKVYEKLMKLIPDLATLKPGDHRKGSRGRGYMNLSMSILEKRDEIIRIALSNHHELSRDLVPDPAMEMIVNFKSKRVQAKMLENTMFHMSTYKSNDPEQEAQMNSFLNDWLRECLENGYNLKRSPSNSNAEVER